MIYFTITIKKRPIKDRVQEELRIQRIQKQIDDVKTKYMHY